MLDTLIERAQQQHRSGDVRKAESLYREELNLFPPGFLGTRADMLMDIVVLSFIVILPVLIRSWHLARHKRQYRVVID